MLQHEEAAERESGGAVGGGERKEAGAESAAVRQLVLELVAEELSRFRKEVKDEIVKINSRLDELSQRVDRRYY